ncbi:hypothetical protein FQZ97_1040520 [compost metagenome]
MRRPLAAHPARPRHARARPPPLHLSGGWRRTPPAPPDALPVRARRAAAATAPQPPPPLPGAGADPPHRADPRQAQRRVDRCAGVAGPAALRAPRPPLKPVAAAHGVRPAAVALVRAEPVAGAAHHAGRTSRPNCVVAGRGSQLHGHAARPLAPVASHAAPARHRPPQSLPGQRGGETVPSGTPDAGRL